MRIIDTNRTALTALAFVIVTNSACGTSPAGSTSDEAFWRALRIDGAEETYKAATLSEMSAKSDLIVVGVVTSFELSRTVQGDAAQDVIGYGGAMIRVEEVIAGQPPDRLIVEFLLPTTATTLTAEGLRSGAHTVGQELPRGHALMFLHEKRGPDEAGLYRLLEFRGLWIDGDGGPVAPLAQDENGAGSLVDRSSVHSLDDMVAALKD